MRTPGGEDGPCATGVDARGPDRRSVLTAGVGGTVLALAGCVRAAPPAETAAAARPSGTVGVTGLGALSGIPVGSAVAVKGQDGEDILISRIGPQTVVAYSAVCPHQGCTVTVSFVCPCHGSTFDRSSGERLSGPATSGLSPVAVSVHGDEIVAG